MVVAFAAIGFAVGGRVLIDFIVPGVVPFALSFPAVIIAAILAGGRAGAMAIIGCQLLVWLFVLRPDGANASMTAELVSLGLATAAQVIAVAAVVGARNALLHARDEAGKRAELLSIALREIDHRTKNNFQIAASLLLSQAAASDAAVAEELRSAAGRLMTIAGTYQNLAVSSSDLSTVLLDQHLEDLCDRLRSGILPPTILLDYRADPATVDAPTAGAIGLIANEWITNAAKHAFPDGMGRIEVELSVDEGTLTLSVRDDGIGGAAGETRGHGSRLLDLLVRSVGGKTKVSTENGRACRLEMALSGA